MEDALKALSKGNKLIYTQRSVPVFQNKVYRDLEEAQNAEIGEVQLAISNQTGFLFNRVFDNSLMNYDANYNNEQSNSTMFNEHLLTVFDLLKDFGIKDKKVVEIGCGKAHFFNIMKQNDIDCIGFDPTYEGDDPLIVKDYFSDKYNINGDLIILRHTLEHIENPQLFLAEIAKSNNYKGDIFIEVPTFEWISQKQAFWDIFYEHCNYFTESSLNSMFNKAKSGAIFGGQYIYCYAPLDSIKTNIEMQEFSQLEGISFDESVQKWKKFLSEKENIVIWGAGAKGSTFLNLLDQSKTKIKFVIDINPEKQNKFIAHTGHPIFSPDILKVEKVDNILVMNENYLEEVRQSINNKNIKLFSL